MHYTHTRSKLSHTNISLSTVLAFRFHPFSICLIVSILSSFFFCWFIIHSSDCFHRLYYFVMCEEGLSSSCLFMIFMSISVVLLVLVCFIVVKPCLCVRVFCLILYCMRVCSQQINAPRTWASFYFPFRWTIIFSSFNLFGLVEMNIINNQQRCINK